MQSENDSEASVHVERSTQVEDILAAEGEKCRGLSWIHTRCEAEMSRYNTFIQVPVIVLSTLAGTASVGSATLFAGQTTASSIAIGLVSISVGLLNTLGGFFNYAKRAESHRIAHLHYSKISTKISIELSLPRLERISAESLLNYVRESMERLAETTPLASSHILQSFNNEFKNLKEEISMPPETNGLHKIKVYRSNGHVPTPMFSLDAMDHKPLEHSLDSKLVQLKSDQEERLRSIRVEQEQTTRRLLEEANQKSLQALQAAEEGRAAALKSAEEAKAEALRASEEQSRLANKAMEEMKEMFQEKQEQLQRQLLGVEKSILPLTQSLDSDTKEEETPTLIIDEKALIYAENRNHKSYYFSCQFCLKFLNPADLHWHALNLGIQTTPLADWPRWTLPVPQIQC
jgi:hypothetical protein